MQAKGKRKRESDGTNGTTHDPTPLYEKLLDVFENPEIAEAVSFFRYPVDVTFEPEYRKVISHPMDLSTIRAKLEAGEYSSPANMATDITLMFDNAIKYNQTRYAHVANHAKNLKGLFNRHRNKIVQNATNAKPAPKSNGVKAVEAKHARSQPVPSNWIPTALALVQNLQKKDKYSVFQSPVDPTVYPTYPWIVLHPCCFRDVNAKLQHSPKYRSPEEFALDVRRISANALRFNATPGDPVRGLARAILWAFELQQTLVEPLFPGAEIALDAVDDLLQQEGVTAFTNPVKSYYGNTFPPSYEKYVSRPLCLGDVTAGVCEGAYSNLEQVREDLHLVFDNCRRYFAAMQSDEQIIQHANQLETHINQYLDGRESEIAPAAAPVAPAKAEPQSLKLSIPKRPKTSAKPSKSTNEVDHLDHEAESDEDSSMQSPAAVSARVLKDLNAKYIWVLDKMLAHKFVAELTHVTVTTSKIFESAVDPSGPFGAEYYRIVENPIDLAMIRKHILKGKYHSAMDFVNDMTLLRDNCYLFNEGQEGVEPRFLADTLNAVFATLLRHVLKQIRDGTDDRAKTAAGLSDPRLQRFLGEKDDPKSVAYLQSLVGPASKPKTAPKPKKAAAPVPAPVPPKVKKQAPVEEEPLKLTVKRATSATVAASAAVSEVADNDPFLDFLDHVPIQTSRVPMVTASSSHKKGKKHGRSSYEGVIAPLHRPAWHELANRALAKLKKHDYVSANSSKKATDWFLPVLTLFPDEAFKQDYEFVIPRPMDLGTVENNLYNDAILDVTRFYEDVCLVFENAITYNEPHTDDADAMFLVTKAKIILQHWIEIALEILPLADDSNVPDAEALGGLRTSLRDISREKRLQMVRAQEIIYINDAPPKPVREMMKRFSSTAVKADVQYFKVPVDLDKVPHYLNYVSDPMDLSTVEKKIETQQYKRYEEFLDDLELVFENGKVFNASFRETDEWSKKIYLAADKMQQFYHKYLHEELTPSAADMARRWDQIERAFYEQELAARQQRDEATRAYEEERQREEDQVKNDKDAAQRQVDKRKQDAMRQLRGDDGDDEGEYIPPAVHTPEMTLKVPKELQPEKPVAHKETQKMVKITVYKRARDLWSSIDNSSRPAADIEHTPMDLEKTDDHAEVALPADLSQHEATTEHTGIDPEAIQSDTCLILPMGANLDHTKLTKGPTGEWAVVESADHQPDMGALKFEPHLRPKRQPIKSELFHAEPQSTGRGKGKGKGKGISFDLPTVAVWDEREVHRVDKLFREEETKQSYASANSRYSDEGDIELGQFIGPRLAPLNWVTKVKRPPPEGYLLVSSCETEVPMGKKRWFGNVVKLFVPSKAVSAGRVENPVNLHWTSSPDGALIIHVGAVQVRLMTRVTRNHQVTPPISSEHPFHISLPFHLYDEAYQAMNEAAMRCPLADEFNLDGTFTTTRPIELSSHFGDYSLNLTDHTVELREAYSHGSGIRSNPAPSHPMPLEYIGQGYFLIHTVQEECVQLDSGRTGNYAVVTLLWNAASPIIRIGTARASCRAHLFPERTERHAAPQLSSKRSSNWPAVASAELTRIEARPLKRQMQRRTATIKPPSGLTSKYFFGEEEQPEEGNIQA